MLESDVPKTAFLYVRKALPPILRAYSHMPFGLKNASAKLHPASPDQQVAYGTLRELMARPGLVMRPIDPARQLILHI